MERNEAEAALRLAAGLWRFWLVRGHFTEGRLRLERVLSASSNVRTTARVRALNGAAALSVIQGEGEQDRTLNEESLALARQLGDSVGIAIALGDLGGEAMDRDDHERSRSFYEEAVALNRGLGRTIGVARCLENLGTISHALGDLDSAQTLYEQALAELVGPETP